VNEKKIPQAAPTCARLLKALNLGMVNVRSCVYEFGEPEVLVPHNEFMEEPKIRVYLELEEGEVPHLVFTCDDPEKLKRFMEAES